MRNGEGKDYDGDGKVVYEDGYVKGKKRIVKEKVTSGRLKGYYREVSYDGMILSICECNSVPLKKNGVCFEFEKKRGIQRIVKAVSNSMKVSENDSLVVQYIQEHTPENAIVFLTGVGKCYPLLRSHNVLNNLHQSYLRAPVVMFFPGTYNEQELILFNEIKDDNYYRAFRLVK